MPSLYARYLKEREDKETIEVPEGFMTYVIEGEECYIETVYVMPDFRKLNIASRMADEVTEIAKKAGCKFLTGSIDPTANGATSSMKVLLAYGFRLHSIKGPLIILIKNI